MSFKLDITDAQIVHLLNPCIDLRAMTDKEADEWFVQQYSYSINYDRNALVSWFIYFDTELEMVEFKLRHL